MQFYATLCAQHPAELQGALLLGSTSKLRAKRPRVSQSNEAPETSVGMAHGARS